jgi:hypothetical protein
MLVMFRRDRQARSRSGTALTEADQLREVPMAPERAFHEAGDGCLVCDFRSSVLSDRQDIDTACAAMSAEGGDDWVAHDGLWPGAVTLAWAVIGPNLWWAGGRSLA